MTQSGLSEDPTSSGALDAKFEGGMRQIARRLAEELGDRVILRKIFQNEEGIRVKTDNGAFAARFLLVAAPEPLRAHPLD